MCLRGFFKNVVCRYSQRQPRTISWQAGENCSKPVCFCWVPGGVFCVEVSWLAGCRIWGPEKRRRVSPFRWRLSPLRWRVGALKRAVAYFFLFSRAAGWTPGGALCVAARWLAWLVVLQYSRAAVFFAAAWSSLRQWLSAGDRAFYRGPLVRWSPSRAVSQVGSVAATDEWWRCWRSLAEPVVTLLVQQTFSCRQRIHESR
jgi:hypothetical protein